jgi:hypothetical protein
MTDTLSGNVSESPTETVPYFRCDRAAVMFRKKIRLCNGHNNYHPY